ncbi:MAG: hypothetical protein KDD70_03055 [Bdellovibrionales bacterium]|nr:hypothetical protein [Bdellovibrionales bacterium]
MRISVSTPLKSQLFFRAAHQLSFMLLLLTGALLTGCGGGGGGSATEGNPAAVTIEISPRRIDSGDRVTATVRLRDIRVFDFNGLIIKVLYPSALDYVANSATLLLPEETDFTFAPTEENADESDYLLFYLDTADVDQSNRIADITFLLEGTGTLAESKVSVDVDAADSDDRDSFDTSSPKFTALSSTSVQVVDS